MQHSTIPLAVLEKSPVLYMVLDTLECVEKANTYTLNLLGQDIIGKPLESLFPKQAIERFDDALSGRSQESFLLNFSDRHGTPQTVQVHIGLEGYGWWIAGFPDVTGLHASQTLVMKLNNDLSVSQRELQKSKTKLEQHLNTLNRFLGMAVHDMRNPLNIIQMYSDLLNEMALSEDEVSQELLTGIKNAVVFMDGLITDFLSTSVLQAGELTLNQGRGNLEQLANESIAFNRFYADKKGIVLAITSDSNVPDMKLDRQKIQQVLNNLISNAIQHAPRGSQVTLAVRKFSDNQAVLIRNIGQPLKDSEIRTIFKPYVKGFSKEKLRGAGLGLAIAKTITDMHHGTLTAYNSGNEVVFRLALPEEVKEAAKELAM